MSSLPITTVKGSDSTDENEKKKRATMTTTTSLQQQRDFVSDLLKNYSSASLDMKYCKEERRDTLALSFALDCISPLPQSRTETIVCHSCDAARVNTRERSTILNCKISIWKSNLCPSTEISCV